MGITLGKPSEGGWMPLYNDAALRVRPATTALVQMAHARADALIAELTEAGVAITKAGGQIVNLPDLGEEDTGEGMRRTLFIVSLAELGATDWRNILDASGEPLPFDAGRLAELFTDPLVSGRFVERYLAGVYSEIEAGNA